MCVCVYIIYMYKIKYLGERHFALRCRHPEPGLPYCNRHPKHCHHMRLATKKEKYFTDPIHAGKEMQGNEKKKKSNKRIARPAAHPRSATLPIVFNPIFLLIRKKSYHGTSRSVY